jgi:UDP-3-O-[3-hydroxymyristoyl] N-acetylglucosamine deacetylase/3-hydroxyacyl-[acyl-carrier-protein] dehydratase
VGRPQRTISRAATLAGPALFSGRHVKVRLLPAETSTGFLFVRTDLPDKPVVPARIEAVTGAFRCTSLNWNGVEVKAVEHLLSACMGLQVDNLMVETDGDELPALGGCPTGYAEALTEAGIVDQNAERPVLKLEQTVTVSQDQAAIVAMPNEAGLAVSYMLDFGDGRGSAEAFSVSVTAETFVRELAPARTFGLEEDYAEFRRLGLGGGVSDENALVLCKDGTARRPLSGAPAQLRFPDEPVRHKVVDLLGDMALANTDLEANVVAVRSGHKLNAAFAAELRRLVEGQAGPQPYLDVREIRRVLPHRYPFLMVDRVLRTEGQGKIVALKNVSVNEPFFQGHFPDYPIMPGVLQLEALAQTAGILFLRKLEHTGKVALLVGMDDVKLRQPVRPGDQLILEAETLRVRSRLAMVKARATVNGQVTCEAEMTFMLADADTV